MDASEEEPDDSVGSVREQIETLFAARRSARSAEASTRFAIATQQKLYALSDAPMHGLATRHGGKGPAESQRPTVTSAPPLVGSFAAVAAETAADDAETSSEELRDLRRIEFEKVRRRHALPPRGRRARRAPHALAARTLISNDHPPRHASPRIRPRWLPRRRPSSTRAAGSALVKTKRARARSRCRR
jgi:hypothetical protein